MTGNDAAVQDADLRAEILAELEWQALIDASLLDVTVEGGVVTVVGTVSSHAEKAVILGAVEMVDGVHDVVSRVDVKVAPGAQPTDVDLHEFVARILEWDALVPEQDLRHSVADGWVRLEGTVPTERQRDEAENAIGRIIGVRGVTNDIAIEPPSLAPDMVREEIVRALERRALHRARQIDVMVDDKRVTLTGSVQSPREKRAILGAVAHAQGVEVVCDELAIRPGS